MPTLSKAAGVLKREAAPRLLSLGRDVLEDVTSGESFGNSLKRRGLNQIRGAATDILAPPTKKRKKRRNPTKINRTGQVGGRKTRTKRRRKRIKRKSRRKPIKKRRSRIRRSTLSSRKSPRDIFGF